MEPKFTGPAYTVGIEEELMILDPSSYALVNAIDDLVEDPQVHANGYVQGFEHPQFGKTRVVGLPVRLSETPGRVAAPAPEFGQHSEEILLDVLGWDWERISELRERKVL